MTRDTTLDRNTDHHLSIVQPPRCDCPDCADSIYYLDPERRWWCRRHSKQAIFVALGHEDLTAGEVVVEEAASFKIVEKRGAEREIVERSDPRAP